MATGTAIIIGAGPFISRSLALFLAAQGFKIGLIGRTQSKLDHLASEIKAKHSDVAIETHVADAGEQGSLSAGLDALEHALGGKVNTLIYNAARVAPSAIMTLDPETLYSDFKTAAIGTLVAGQWFSKHADLDNNPVLLITGGTLDRSPNADYASLSAAKSASQSISVMFSQVLPEQGILVGTPLIVEPIIPIEGKGGYATKSDPDVIVEKIYKPYFDGRKSPKEWQVERIW